MLRSKENLIRSKNKKDRRKWNGKKMKIKGRKIQNEGKKMKNRRKQRGKRNQRKQISILIGMLKNRGREKNARKKKRFLMMEFRTEGGIQQIQFLIGEKMKLLKGDEKPLMSPRNVNIQLMPHQTGNILPIPNMTAEMLLKSKERKKNLILTVNETLRIHLREDMDIVVTAMGTVIPMVMVTAMVMDIATVNSH